MNLEEELAIVKRKQAMVRCFEEEDFFDACPLAGHHYPEKSRDLLDQAHCIHFKHMSEEMVGELKRLVHEVMSYEEPVKEEPKRWWQVWK